ncbi:hypothetical protein [Legionella sp. PC1000]
MGEIFLDPADKPRDVGDKNER